MVEGFLAGALVATVVLFIVMPLFVFRPRLWELTNERDEWRERAIQAEDSAGVQTEQQYRITGRFEQPVTLDQMEAAHDAIDT